MSRDRIGIAAFERRDYFKAKMADADQPEQKAAQRRLSPAAERALAEAAARRAERDRARQERPEEFPKRGGPDPVRYGDWEVNGIASDF
jgi:hypothetical protein